MWNDLTRAFFLVTVGLAAAGILLACVSLGMGSGGYLAGHLAAVLWGAVIGVLGLWVALTTARRITRRYPKPHRPDGPEADYRDPPD